MRRVYSFVDEWLYCPKADITGVEDAEFEVVTIPHSNIVLPHHNFDDSEYQFVSHYRKRFSLPEPILGRRVLLEFEGVMTAATVRINGHIFDEQRGGFVPFTYDLTDFLIEDGENLLEVMVDSRERADIPPHGGQVDYLVFGGIYRDIHLCYVEQVHITNLRVRTIGVLSEEPRLEIDLWVRNSGQEIRTVRLAGSIEHPLVSWYWIDLQELDVIIPPGETMRAVMRLESKSIRDFGAWYTNEPDDTVEDLDYLLWDLDSPHQYDAQVAVFETAPEGKEGLVRLDFASTRFGFREAEFREDGFYLNGKKVFLRGLNRHQTYPYIGCAAPKRLQERDAEIIKTELGCNIVRTSHYPQSKHFLDRCDEIGLLVFEEIPGWQHIGDEEWQELSLRDVRLMIERDWNHPSIVVWGVRINESWDSSEFYTKTNQLARELDPTRQTSGVRFWPHSEFLEDVYAYNDFSNGVIEPVHSPWLITEFNGHMYPTKTFDNEERQMEHMRRHAHIQAQAASTGGVSGAIGWCAFDYNTHLDFGSGDRICYHGVMDLFRQPKWAGYFYKSQKAPEDEIVLQVASFWTMGDRAGGGNDPLYILTNCERIAVYIGEELIGEYEPTEEEFPNLEHPPIKVSGLGLHWGKQFAQLRVVGYHNSEPVVEQMISADGIPKKLICIADHSELKADGIDMTWLVFKITDEFGNRLPNASQVVQFEVIEGDVEIIGENPFALVGGQAALLIRAGKQPGQAVIRASTPRLEAVEVVITLFS